MQKERGDVELSAVGNGATVPSAVRGVTVVPAGSPASPPDGGGWGCRLLELLARCGELHR